MYFLYQIMLLRIEYFSTTSSLLESLQTIPICSYFPKYHKIRTPEYWIIQLLDPWSSFNQKKSLICCIFKTILQIYFIPVHTSLLVCVITKFTCIFIEIKQKRHIFYSFSAYCVLISRRFLKMFWLRKKNSVTRHFGYFLKPLFCSRLKCDVNFSFVAVDMFIVLKYRFTYKDLCIFLKLCKSMKRKRNPC